MVRLLLGFLLATLGGGFVRGAEPPPPRMAVIASDGTEDFAALLTARLSAAPGLVVLDRADFAKIADERALREMAGKDPAALGQLLHADALLVLGETRLAETPLRMARLVAVQPGVMIGSAALDSNPSSQTAEAARIADQFLPLLGKLASLDPQGSVKVSLLGLRFELNTPLAAGTERALNTLLAERLTHRPRILVLERWSLAAAAGEKDLQPGEGSPFWTGSCLVDGRIAEKGEKLLVEVRLRRGGGAPPATLSLAMPADRIANLADALADRIAAALGASEAAPAWDRKGEARNQTLLSHWALGNRLYPEAFEAAATADALCPRTPDIELLRLECETQLAFPRPPFVDRRSWTPYNPARDGVPELPAQLDAAQAGLGHLLALRKRGVDDPAFQPAAARIRVQAIYTVQQVSRLLSAARESGVWKKDEPRFAEVRHQVRDEVEAMLAQDLGYQTRASAYLFPFAPYWFETPDETLVFYRRLAALPGNPAFPPPLVYFPIRWKGGRPWLVAWHGETKTSLDTAWDGFLDAMRRSPSLQEQVAGWVWKIDSALWNDRPALLAGLTDFAWAHRAEAVRSDAPVDLSPLGETLSAYDLQLGSPPRDPAIQKIGDDFFPYLLQAGAWIRPRTLHAFGMVAASLAPEDIGKTAPLFAAYRTAMAVSPAMTSSAQRELDRVERDLFSRAEGEGVRYAARFFDMAGPDGAASNIRNPIAVEGRVWFIDAHAERVVGWDPVAGVQESIPYGKALVGHLPAVDLAVGPRCLFLRADNLFWQYDRAKQAWLRLDLPPAVYSASTAAGTTALLYRPLGEEKDGGGILALNPDTQVAETILSSRSNPPRNELDGRTDGRGIFLRASDDGALDYVVKLATTNASAEFRSWGDHHDDLYTRKTAASPWERILSVSSTFTNINHLAYYPMPGGALLVVRNRLGSTNLSDFGQLVAWDRASGKVKLLLSNPAAVHPPVEGVAQWEMPPDFACTEATPAVMAVPAMQGGVLWVLRWERRGKEQGMRFPAVYRFRPGVPQGERVAIDFDPEKGISPNVRRGAVRRLHPGDVAVHASGFVLERSPELGLWYLPFAGLNQALDQPQPAEAAP